MGAAIGRDWPARSWARAATFAFATLAASIAIGDGRAHADEAVSPQAGEKLPLGTALTGRCQPAQAPSGGDQVERAHRWIAFVQSDQLSPLDPDDSEYPAYSHNQAIRPEGDYYEESCAAYDVEYNNNPPATVNGVPAFRVTDAGSWYAYPLATTITWGYDGQDSDEWGNVGSWDAVLDAINFKVYDPCHVIARAVSGRAVKGRPGQRTETVRRGTVISQGDTLTVQSVGKDRGGVQVENPEGGYRLGFGPGDYQFSDIRKCTEFFEQGRAAQLPEEPTKAEVKKGVIEQAFEEFGSIVKAGKDLYNEGIFSKLKRAPRAAESRRGAEASQGRFKVVRRKGKTRSCALAGKLRVYTEKKSVPKRKREVVLKQGQCAVTKDGRAPRRVRR